MEKKQKLMTEIEKLEATHNEVHEELMSMRPPKMENDLYEPLDRKQQEMIILKNKLVTQMR